MKKTVKAFTLVEIMIVVAIIGILIAIAVPGFIRAREVSRRNSCQENLTKIDGAKSTWSLENNKASSDSPAWTDLVQANDQGYLRFQPVCPLDSAKDGSTYTIGTIDEFPSCDQGEGDFVHVYPTGAGAGGAAGS
jgi:prepilin-type N-terminal cleavage/methylation domain-containing protein